MVSRYGVPILRVNIVIFYLFPQKNESCGNPLQMPCQGQGTSNEYTQHIYFYGEIENIRTFCVKLEMCPKDTEVPCLTCKLLMPENQTQIANAISDAAGDRQMDRGNTLCPFHHSLNGGGHKKPCLKLCIMVSAVSLN